MNIIREYSIDLRYKDQCFINCSSAISSKCIKRVESTVQTIRDNLKRNNGSYVCRSCSQHIRTEKEIKERAEEKMKYLDDKLKTVLVNLKLRELSGKVQICSAKNHQNAAKNCIPEYPYKKNEIPVEDFYDEKTNKKYKLCLGCRVYRSQCRTVTNAKRQTQSYIPETKTCLANFHFLASKLPRENIPIKYFLKDMEDPNSKVVQNCYDCRKHIKKTEKERTKKILEKGGIYCEECKVEKTIDEMAKNLNETMTKCKRCKERETNHWIKRYDDLMKYYRKIQLDRIFEKECCCEVCRAIFIKPDEGGFICKKLETRSENGFNFVEYENKTYLVKDFLLEYSDLIEYRVLDFDHLPTDDPEMKKIQNVSRFKSKEDILKESLKCQLVDCECHLKETIKREKGDTIIYGKHVARKLFVDNIKRKGCEFCNYIPENDKMLRFIHLDHIDPELKVNNISTMVSDLSYSPDDLRKEITKCRPLCAFCHRILTHYFCGSSYVENYTSVNLQPVEHVFEN